MTPDEQDAVIAWARAEPEAWLKQVFGADLWGTQSKILRSFMKNRITCVPSSHASGKSYTAAHAALYALLTNPGSKVLTTATTHQQLTNGLWGEIRGAFERHNARARAGLCPPIGASPLTNELKLGPTWMAYGISSDMPESYQGVHATGGVFIIIDEADGLDAIRWEAIKSNLSTAGCHALLIGNPLDPNSVMSVLSKNPETAVIPISAFNTPNFTSFEITENDIENDTWKEKITGPYPAPWLVTPDYAANTLFEDGRDSIAYQSRVLGAWPVSSEDSLIQGAWLQAAFDLWSTSAPTTNDRPSLGLDVARYGTDKSVVAVYRGKRLWVSDAKGQLDSEGSAALLLNRAYAQHNEVRQNTAVLWRAFMDVAGVGAGVYDVLKRTGRVTGVDNATRAKDPERFINTRAQNFWNIREALRNGELALDPHDRELAEELGSIRYKVVRGKIQIEEKDQIRKRLKRSPDRADAVVLAYACGGEKNAVVGFMQAMGRR